MNPILTHFSSEEIKILTTKLETLLINVFYQGVTTGRQLGTETLSLQAEEVLKTRINELVTTSILCSTCWDIKKENGELEIQNEKMYNEMKV